MAPPPAGAPQPSRRSNDPKQALQAGQNPPDSRDGPPPGYQQRFPGGGATPTSGPGQSPIPPTVGGNQGPNYRGGPPQREQYGPPGVGEQGRSTPPPAPERDVNDAYKELCKLELTHSLEIVLNFWQYKNTKKSKVCTLIKQPRLSSYKIHLPIKGYRNRELLLTIANT